MPAPDTPHIPVLRDAVLAALRPGERPAGRFVDGTLGAGGHAAAILEAAPDARLLGLDRDPAALALAAERLAPFGERATLIHASYEQMAEHVAAWLGDDAGVDGILLDLGISSMQVDDPARGFSFMQDGPLDMRFDPTAPGPTAAEIVNTWPADDLADILFRYGEERNSRRIVRAIVEARPLATTRQLAEVVAAAQRGPREKIHPATRTFQALRIAVNDELGAVERRGARLRLPAAPAGVHVRARGAGGARGAQADHRRRGRNRPQSAQPQRQTARRRAVGRGGVTIAAQDSFGMRGKNALVRAM